ncbi:MAG: SdiA-regulated domain-containing protein [Bacteroidetes bacterium]|nr:SdiA-regulated domain-containing protein [Fibrella sp.]
MQQLVSVLLIGMAAAACQPGQKSTTESETSTAVESAPIPYDLTQPADRYKLPADLTEISGLSYYKPGRLACIQDELAVVFIYDLAQRRVRDEHVFGKKGDYEGVEFVDGELYALRSDGEIYHFRPTDTDGVKILGGGGPQVKHIKIDLPGKNDMEGLGYDPKLDALLLATKSADRRGTDKQIYFYGLKGKALYQGPLLKQADLQAFVGADKSEVKPSGLAVHPQTGNYYVLASGGRRLVVMTRNGKLLSSVALAPKLFRQPEGICFAPDGTLFIASEGDGGSGTILRFVMK